MTISLLVEVKGGTGSGNWGHTGRPGLVGGSGGGAGGMAVRVGGTSELATSAAENMGRGDLQAPLVYDLLANGRRYAGKGNKWDVLTSDELKVVRSTLDDLKGAGRAAQRAKYVRSPAGRDIQKWRGWQNHIRGMSADAKAPLVRPLAKLVDVYGVDKLGD